MFSWLRRLFCKHQWEKTAVVDAPPNTVFDFDLTGAYEETCTKCSCVQVVLLCGRSRWRNLHFITSESNARSWPRSPMSPADRERFDNAVMSLETPPWLK
jgi:hypothetical protein